MTVNHDVAGSSPAGGARKKHFERSAFFNDVCLRQMMLASPMMTASPNDVWLRHILWQTSHHCGTEWSNIILSEAKNIISPQAMHHLTSTKTYDIIIEKEVQ